MPYADAVVQADYQHQHYLDNKDEVRARNRRRRKERKLWFISVVMAGRACVTCGESDLACLDFHHRVPAEKSAGISKLLTAFRSKERILAEIEKCDVLCSNCHRKLHREIMLEHHGVIAHLGERLPCTQEAAGS